ncbi:MAG: caspase domain-containing protein [Parvibaculaceae bacterium]
MRRARALCLLAFLALAFQFSPALAARIALVIGNDAYANLPPDKQLKKAVNDSRAVGDALEKIGFTVIRGENLDRQGMIDRIFDFTQKVQPGDTALVFYAGHGVAIGGGNFLLPADVRSANPGEEARVRNMAIGEADIIADLQERKAQVSVLILDACRDNPFRQPGTRSAGQDRGLARVTEAQGVFAIYSAGFGQSALDSLGEGDAAQNSVFTRVLVPALEKPGVHLADLMIDVRQEVAALAASVGREQDPAYYDQSRGGRIFLNGSESGTGTATVQPKTAAIIVPPVPATPPADRRGSVGRIWYVEENDNWRGIWTRRGTSDVFDAISGQNFDIETGFAPSRYVDLSTASMEIVDGRITIKRRFPRVACIYDGELDPGGEKAEGTYECNHVTGVYKWSARISDQLPPAQDDDWRGQVWHSTEGGVWQGVWKRRGMSPIFDAEWRLPGQGGYEVAQLYIQVDGDNVTVYRDQDKGRCTYRGKRRKDQRTIVGSVECDWATAEWKADLVN